MPRGIASVWGVSSPHAGLGSLGVGALSVADEPSVTPKSAAGSSSGGGGGGGGGSRVDRELVLDETRQQRHAAPAEAAGAVVGAVRQASQGRLSIWSPRADHNAGSC